MNREYDKNIGIGDDYFLKMRIDADSVLQKLLENMVEKGSKEATMTIKIDVKFHTEFISDYDTFGDPCGGHDAIVPAFTHKISSVMQIKDETKGINFDKFLELHYDEEDAKYILTPIKGAQQMNLFETQMDEDESSEEYEGTGTPDPATATAEEAIAADCIEVEEGSTDGSLPFGVVDDEDLIDDSDYAAFDGEYEEPVDYTYEEPTEYPSN